MSEELEQSNDGTWSGLKKTIIGVATTAVMGLGTWGITKITGGEEDKSAAPAQPSIIINNTQQQQQAASGGKTVIVKEKTVEKPAAPVKKKEGDEFKEKPAQW